MLFVKDLFSRPGSSPSHCHSHLVVTNHYLPLPSVKSKVLTGVLTAYTGPRHCVVPNHVEVRMASEEQA